jgi:hypothetical protein
LKTPARRRVRIWAEAPEAPELRDFTGVQLRKHPLDLRHTYATFALRAGVPVSALSRFMGTSIATVDLHYATSQSTATSTPSRSSTHSRLSARWTLGGHSEQASGGRTAPQFGVLVRAPRAGGARSVDIEATPGGGGRTRKG